MRPYRESPSPSQPACRCNATDTLWPRAKSASAVRQLSANAAEYTFQVETYLCDPPSPYGGASANHAQKSTSASNATLQRMARTNGRAGAMLARGMQRSPLTSAERAVRRTSTTHGRLELARLRERARGWLNRCKRTSVRPACRSAELKSATLNSMHALMTRSPRTSSRDSGPRKGKQPTTYKS